MIQLTKAVPTLMTAVHIASLGFVQAVSQGLADDVAFHLASGKLVYRIFDNGSEAGFAIFATHDDILYLSGIILVPESQSKGLAGNVVLAAQQETNTDYLALRTQSLRMYLAVTKLFSDWYPKLASSTAIPKPFADRGSVVAKAINSHFPIHQGCYGGPLYGAKPTHRNNKLQQQWDALCNFEQGDAVIVIGRLR